MPTKNVKKGVDLQKTLFNILILRFTFKLYSSFLHKGVEEDITINKEFPFNQTIALL